MLSEERNDYRTEFFPSEDFVAITMLMIRASIFLKVDTSASEEIFECRENVFVLLDEFYVEFWLYDHSPSDFLLRIWISHVDREASFTIHESDNILWTKIVL